jgi:prepilin-type N-terminal cleavage/methylation domain-containing protein/prepilin-type processing-associated H-X9-DG protein
MIYRRFALVKRKIYKSCGWIFSMCFSFTLIELLVTIAIIAILASVLLPVLSKVKAKSREIQCISNLRQMHMSYSFYTGDFNGYLIPFYNTNTGGKWYVTLYDAGYMQPSPSVAPDKHVVWTCPSEPLHDGTHRDGHTVTWTSLVDYGTNDHIVPRYPAKPYVKLLQIHNPGDTFLMGDANYYRLEVGVLNNYDYVDYRHADGMNMVFIDGHASWMRGPLPGDWEASPWNGLYQYP